MVAVVGCLGCAEDDHDSVANELVHGGAEGLSNLGHLREIFVQQRGKILGFHLVGCRGEAYNVREEERKFASFGTRSRV